MKVVYFFTYGYTLKIWEESGSLEREFRFFKYLNENYGVKFTLVTYGDELEHKYVDNIDYLNVVPIYEYLKFHKSKLVRYLYSFAIPFKIKKTIGEFDLIKQNQLLGSWVTILFKLTTRKPLLTRTGYDMYSFSIYENKSFVLRFFYYLLTQITLVMSSSYTVSSEKDKKVLKKAFLFGNKNIDLIPNWVEINSVQEDKNRYENRILCIGRLESQKNFSYVIESLNGSDIQIDIYGEGNLKNYLLKLAVENNVKVNFFGTVPYSKLQQIYKDYTIFISSSKYEGNPKTILEAMASKCLVLASNIPNNLEIIKNNENGFLFNFNDDLSKMINYIFENQSEMKKITDESFRTVCKTNSISKIAELQINSYRKLVT